MISLRNLERSVDLVTYVSSLKTLHETADVYERIFGVKPSMSYLRCFVRKHGLGIYKIENVEYVYPYEIFFKMSMIGDKLYAAKKHFAECVP